MNWELNGRDSGDSEGSQLIQFVWSPGEWDVVDDKKLHVAVFASLPCHMHNFENRGSANSRRVAAVWTFYG